MKHTTIVTLLGLAAAGLVVYAAGAKEEGAPADAPALANYERTGAFENCLSVNRIDYSRILNKRQILFEMIDNEVYLNEPKACPGLGSFVALRYDATSNLLCNTTAVTLIDTSSSVPMRGSCIIGRFEKLKTKVAAQ